jgi:hypothetical protein
MKPFGHPPKEDHYKFVVIGHRTPEGVTGAYGPFPSVFAADQWWDEHMSEVQGYTSGDYEVVLMEAPEDGT